MTTQKVSGTPSTNIYREVLFAGFPSQGQQGFTSAFVRGFFSHYGAVQNFIFDAERGIGSVTFATGDIAVNCYLAVHLSLLPSPDNAHNNNDNDKNNNDDNDVYLLYLEFAQSCPFVNPKLLVSGDMSRYHLRYYKQKITKRIHSSLEKTRTNGEALTAVVASHIVVLWRDPDETDEITTTITEKRQLVRDGPNFPVVGEDIPKVLTEALWIALKPNGDSIAGGDVVTVLDLWWEFYQRYVLHKTEPEASRIKDPYYKYAQKATVAQEIYRVLKISKRKASGDEEYATAVIHRLMRDDVYHSVCGYLCFKFRFHNDPIWASLLRDITSGTEAAKAFHAANEKNSRILNRHNNNNNNEDDAETDKDEAEMALLKMPILTAATNVMENVRFLRAVRHGARVDNTESDANAERLDNYTTSSPTRLDEESFYMEVLHTIDGFAPHGDAAGLMSICESPQIFRDTPGHIGWCEVHKKSDTSVWWVRCQAIAVALIILALVAWGMSALASWLGLVNSMDNHNNIYNNIHRGSGYRQGRQNYDNLPADVKRKVNIQFARL
ncbi:hypothetical protein LSM04_003558 [Trypanosoma melophagium]|uniref:uncharacterized protein n=1 Tax=Trypanosoma melophagium TaxID=715481 RepID=UPI00351AA366|nr:hypothetical protein LSM04_003558 [Trypanosoma melophagium]